MNLRLPHALALALAVGTACTPDPDPLPGYVPDPDEYTVPAEVAKVRDVPDAPGLQAPVDHLLLVLAPDAGREVAETIATSEGGTIVGQIPALRFYQLKLPTETMDALFAAIDRARLVPGVEAAGLDPVVQFSGCPAESDIDRLPTAALRCPWESADYSPTLTAFEEMRDELDLHDVTVGIVDSPLDFASGEFDDVRLASVDHPGGRFPEELEEPDVDDEGHNHGTAVAQIIAGDDDTGINGIASRFLGRRLRVAYSQLPMGGAARAAAANALMGARRLVAAGAHVVNVSIAVTPTNIDRGLFEALRFAFEELATENPRVLFVVAAGNDTMALDGTNVTPAGASWPNLLTVGSFAACQPTLAAAHSNRGRVDIAAQGEAVYVYDSSSGREATLQGTSFAAPQVTALAAVLHAVAPELDGAALRRVILDGAAPGPAELGGRALNLGRPILDVVRERSSLFVDVIDRDGDAESDPVSAVAARLCDGSGYLVEGVAAYGYYSNDDPSSAAQGQIASSELEGQFGMSLQHPGRDGLAFVVEAPFALGTFSLGDTREGSVSFVDESRAVAGRVVSGTWTVESCTILDRWDRLVAATDAPKTVLVHSQLDAVVELDFGEGEPVPSAIRGSFVVPFESFAGGSVGSLRLEFDRNDPVLRTLEAMCDGGRG